MPAVLDRLTQTEAEARAAVIHGPVRYRPVLRFAADPAVKTFRSEVTLEFDAAPGASTFIDLLALRLDHAELNGVPIDVTRYRDARLPLDNLQAHNTLTVASTHVFSDTGAGLTRVPDPQDGGAPYLHTQFEHNHAHKTFACFDQPDIKGFFRFAVEAPQNMGTVLTNATERRVADLGNGMRRHEFGDSELISTYLAAVVSGPFMTWTDSYRSIDGRVIPLSWSVRRSQAQFVQQDARELFEITKAALRHYETEKGTPYPYPKLDQAFVPGFKAGAMENAAMVTYAEQYVFRGAVPARMREARESVIWHELDHMWDGDLVTMRWWNDLGLNESSATAGATDGLSKVGRFGNPLITANVGKATASVYDQRRSTHAVFPTVVSDTTVVNDNFDPLTYQKGAATLRQLRAYVGEKAYIKGMRRYYKQYAGKNPTRWDRINALQWAARDKDLTLWAKQWWESTGINVLRPSYSTPGCGMRDVVVEQGVAANGDNVLRTHVLNVALYDRDYRGGLVLRRRIRMSVSGARTRIPKLGGERAPALMLVNEGDLTYAKVRLDPASLATTLSSLSAVPDALARTQLWGVLWDMVRDAEMPARRLVDTVCRQTPLETDARVLETALTRGLGAIETYADPAARDGLRRRLAAVARAQVEDPRVSEPCRLAWFDAWLATAMVRDRGAPDAGDVARLRGLLATGGALPGLRVASDPDLRWKAVIALAGAGAMSEAEIDAEGVRDGSIKGQASRLQALAARPLAAAKDDAWRMLTAPRAGDPQMTPQNMRALLAGFGHAGQGSLRASFAAQFPAAAARVHDERTQEQFKEIAAGLLPSGQDALSAAAAALAIPAIASDRSARRLFLDAEDDAHRALAGRARDGAEGLLHDLDAGRDVA